MTDLPFSISPEGERHLQQRLQSELPEGRERSLTHCYSLKVRDKDGKVVEQWDHELFILGSGAPDQHVDFARMQVAGYPLSMSRRTLESLKGRCLTVQQLARLDKPTETREILVAIPIRSNTYSI